MSQKFDTEIILVRSVQLSVYAEHTTQTYSQCSNVVWEAMNDKYHFPGTEAMKDIHQVIGLHN